MATSTIKKENATETLTFTVNSSTISNPESITAFRSGNVVQVTFWGTKFKSGLSSGTNAVSGLPACARQSSAFFGLAGSSSYNIQGNVFNAGENGTTLNVGLKSGYSVETAMYACLIYICIN